MYKNRFSSELESTLLSDDGVESISQDELVAAVLERIVDEYTLTGPNVSDGVDIDEEVPALMRGEDGMLLVFVSLDSVCADKMCIRLSVEVGSGDEYDSESAVQIRVETETELPYEGQDVSASDVGEYVWELERVIEGVFSCMESGVEEEVSVVGGVRDI